MLNKISYNELQTALAKAQDHMENVRSRAKNIAQKYEGAIDGVFHTAEAATAAYLWGMLRGKYGGQKMQVFGVPGDLAFGATLSVGSLLLQGALGERLSAHLNHIGMGALCSYTTVLGHDRGALSREGAQQWSVSGNNAPAQLAGAQSLHETELARLALETPG